MHMGQYFTAVNLDARQTIDPSRLRGGGAKLSELALNTCGAAAALLLATLSARARTELGLTGLPDWNGARVGVTGDYAPAWADRDLGAWAAERLSPDGAPATLYGMAEAMPDVSEAVVNACAHRGIASPFYAHSEAWELREARRSDYQAAAFENGGPRFAVRNRDSGEHFAVWEGFWEAVSTPLPGLLLLALTAHGNGESRSDLPEHPRIGSWAFAHIETVLLEELDGGTDITAELHGLVEQAFEHDPRAGARLLAAPRARRPGR